jgi:hypothetical protein
LFSNWWQTYSPLRWHKFFEIKKLSVKAGHPPCKIHFVSMIKTNMETKIQGGNPMAFF